MIKARFHLDVVRNEDKPTLVLLACSCSDKRLRYSTKLKVIPKKWDKKQMRVIGRSLETKKINTQLEFLLRTFDSIILTYQKQGISVAKDLLKNDLDIALGRTKPKEETIKISLLPFWKLFIEERSEESKGYSPNTLKKYKVGYNGLEKYLKKSKK